MPVKTRKQARVCPCTILATCARPVDIDVRAEGLITNCRATRSLQRPWLAYRGLAEYICMTWHMKRHPAARRKIDIRSACTKDCNPMSPPAKAAKVLRGSRATAPSIHTRMLSAVEALHKQRKTPHLRKKTCSCLSRTNRVAPLLAKGFLNPD